VKFLLHALKFSVSRRSNKVKKDFDWLEHISSWCMLTMLICWMKTYDGVSKSFRT